MQSDSNIFFVEQMEKELVVSHKIIAEQTENKEKSILDLITRNLAELKEFGNLRFKIVDLERQTKKGSFRGKVESKIYYLNEPQTTLLLTFMRNNEIVKKFKIKLVKEFFKMREILKSQNSEFLETSQQTFDLDSYISENEKLIKLVKLITSENTITLYYLDKLTKSSNLKSPLELLQIDLNSHYFIPTELGKILDKSAVEINKILEHKGYQIKINEQWELTEAGKEFAISVKNKLFTQIKWKLEAVA
jgi:phage regulator Rha-like protein